MDKWDKQSWNQKIIPKKQKVVMSKSTKIIYGIFLSTITGKSTRKSGNFSWGKWWPTYGFRGDQPSSVWLGQQASNDPEEIFAAVMSHLSAMDQWLGNVLEAKTWGKTSKYVVIRWVIYGYYMGIKWVSCGYHMDMMIYYHDCCCTIWVS